MLTYFQHRPFFDGDVEKNNYKIAEAGAIHIEPFGFYSKTVKSKDQMKEVAKSLFLTQLQIMEES